MNNTIPVIPITGPPCSGKTTVLSIIRSELLSLDYSPLIIPETATAIFGMGLDKTLLPSIDLQKQVFQYQLQQENYTIAYAEKIALLGKKPVIICDRSLLDGQAYTTSDDWETVLNELNFRQTEIAHRYSSSIYLEVAPEQFYTRENNEFRDETYEEAIVLGEKIKTSYLSNHLWIVDNRGDFETKKFDAKSNLRHILGYPEPIEDELKFEVLSKIAPKDLRIPYVKSEITQHYLVSDDSRKIRRVRKRVFPDSVTIFTYTSKDRETKVEREKIITMRDYFLLLGNAIPSKKPVIKDRYCFIWKNQYFELDFFKNIDRNPLLEIEKTKIQTEVIIPEWLGDVENVTDLSSHQNENFV
jgi:thymidylate kinase/CYTH domain-containing protein